MKEKELIERLSEEIHRLAKTIKELRERPRFPDIKLTPLQLQVLQLLPSKIGNEIDGKFKLVGVEPRIGNAILNVLIRRGLACFDGDEFRRTEYGEYVLRIHTG